MPLAGGGRASETVITDALDGPEYTLPPADKQPEPVPPGLDPVRHSICPWCGAAFLPNRTGSRQRFCTSGCRNALWSAARRWAGRALDQGLLSLAALKACTLPTGVSKPFQVSGTLEAHAGLPAREISSAPKAAAVPPSNNDSKPDTVSPRSGFFAVDRRISSQLRARTGRRGQNRCKSADPRSRGRSSTGSQAG